MSAWESQRVKELYEFGPFRVNVEKETLLRSGEPVPLTPKAFQILLVLIRHGNEVVTKDDLMKEVWPDSFVEEANLSRNVFMLRKALGETPQEHRYILTVPGRGYRLAETVRMVPEQEVSIVAAKHSKIQVHVEQSRPWVLIVALLFLLMLVVAAGLFRFRTRRGTTLGAKDTVVLADFTNSTGDPVFDGTLRQGMAVQLEQSPFLSLVSEGRIQQTLRLMGQPADARLTPELARELCERTGSAAVLQGSIASLGSKYVLGLRATNCHTGEVLDDEQAQAQSKEDVLNALTLIAGKFRTRVGESISSVTGHNTPLAEATTPSLEALKAYSAAWKVHSSTGAAAALPLFKRAVELDPQFAMAHASLGRIYGDLDQSDLSAASTIRAWELRDRVSEHERFFITAEYHMQVSGNLEEAQQTCEAWAQTYPRESLPHNFLAGVVNKVTGRYEKGVEEARKAVDLDPDFAMGYFNLGVNLTSHGRFDEAETILKRAAERGLENDEIVMLRYEIAFLRGDPAAMEREAARARQRSGGDNWIFNTEAFTLAYSGHLQKARTMSRLAVSQAEHAGQRERAGLWEAGAAVREAFYGNPVEARKSAMATLEVSKDREVEYGAAFALALLRDNQRAQLLADDLEKRFPEDTSVRFSYLPTLRARLALNHGDAAKAIELLQSAVPNELGVPRSSIHALFGALYPVYVRGEAYLAEDKNLEAAMEFQKIIAHPSIVVSDPSGVMARLQIARAYAAGGDRAKAKAAYQDFLTFWKDADADIAILKQASAEDAKLQ